MKKTLSLLAVSILLTSFAYSQMNTGSYFVSGNTNFDFGLGSVKYVDVDDNKANTTCFYLTPKAGYFIKNRIAVGGLINLSIDISNQKDALYEYKFTESEWYIGPFGRYYVEYGKLIPFAEVSLAFGGNKSKTDIAGDASETTHSVFIISGGVGASYFLTESFALEGLIQYSRNRQKPTWEGADGEGHVISGVNFMIGVAVYFGKI